MLSISIPHANESALVCFCSDEFTIPNPVSFNIFHHICLQFKKLCELIQVTFATPNISCWYRHTTEANIQGQHEDQRCLKTVELVPVGWSFHFPVSSNLFTGFTQILFSPLLTILHSSSRKGLRENAACSEDTVPRSTLPVKREGSPNSKGE